MAKGKTAAEAKSSEIRINEQKWGKPLIAAGFTILPNMIFAHQAELGLKPTDINILMHLLSYWWSPGDLPHPSKRTIATRMAIDPRTVQRRIAALEKRGLIARQSRNGPHRGTQTNVYHFDGLITAATIHARKEIDGRAKRDKDAADKAAKLAKAKPTLTVV